MSCKPTAQKNPAPAPAGFAIPNPAPAGFEKIKSGATLLGRHLRGHLYAPRSQSP